MTESEPVKKNEFQRPISKKHVRFSRVLLAVAGILCMASVVFWWMCIRMPGKSFQANAASAVQEPKQEKPQTTKPNQTQQSAETQQGTEQPKDVKKKLTTEEELNLTSFISLKRLASETLVITKSCAKPRTISKRNSKSLATSPNVSNTKSTAWIATTSTPRSKARPSQRKS